MGSIFYVHTFKEGRHRTSRVGKGTWGSAGYKIWGKVQRSSGAGLRNRIFCETNREPIEKIIAMSLTEKELEAQHKERACFTKTVIYLQLC